MRDTAVAILDLTKTYGEVTAVEGLTLEVPRGQILAVLGPSGCGKTTLLRLIAGFERPDRGTIRINGTVATDGLAFLPPERRRVGMVFQNHALFPHLSVAHNIAFGLQPQRGQAARARVGQLLELVGLVGLEDRYPHELSGGESQRVALARALAPEPVIVLLDEPFSNLDADRRVRIRDEVRAILKRAQTSAVFVTHDQEEAIFMGDLLAVMKDGRLQQMASPEQIFGAPASRFIAEFLGHAEFLQARVRADDLTTEIGPLAQKIPAAPGTLVEVAFRADDITFEPNPGGDATVEARFFQGAVNTYRLRLPSGRTVHSLQPHYLDLAPGTPVRVWFEPNHPLPVFKDGQPIG